MSLKMKVVPIIGVIQKYAWGKKGDQSEVAKLYKGSNPSFVVQSDTPYAELWFGTHPKGTSNVISCSEPLTCWLSRNLSVNNGSAELPFLFKVLSVDTALSIQIHPNKLEAVKLHASNPKEYPDDNHKPEMAIALTPFEALCGFRPSSEIESYVKKLDELKILTKNLIGEVEDGGECKFNFKKSFISLMNCDAHLVKEQSVKLYEMINKCSTMQSDINHRLFCRLYAQNPGDVGCFCVYFLNYIQLQPGQSLFLQSNLPHAYIHGDCVECMANSDNVIRAGLTPKFRDVDTLCRLVEYKNREANDILFEPTRCPHDQHLTLYKPPVTEFAVERICLPRNFGSYHLPSVNMSSIILIIRGQAKIHSKEETDDLKVCRGSALFVAMKESLHLVQCDDVKDDDDCDDALLMFRAFSQI